MSRLSYPQPGDTLKDIQGQTYQLAEQLGQGGQGAVFSTIDPKLLAKICISHKSHEIERTRDRFKVLSLRNLKIQSLILPRAVLEKPHLGYLMDRVEGGISLAHLVYPQNSQNLKDQTDVDTWYQSTGGLRRRLRICAELARTFVQIHQAGLCYVDLSLQNVLIFSDPQKINIRLIDPDNLIVPGTSLAQVLGTPWFIAPELLTDDRLPDYASDRWSLAVMIYYVLVLNHPFMGDQVMEGEPELEDAALEGKLPFIDSSKDHQNASSYGLPRNKVLTTKLQRLFAQTFEQGIYDRWGRPSAEDWLELLEAAADKTALCTKCNGTSYLPKIRQTTFVCDWCGQANKRPIEIGFFPPDPLIKDLEEEEKKVLLRSRSPHRLVLDRGQRYLPIRLISEDKQSTGYAAQYGTTRNQNNELIYGLKNLTQQTWYWNGKNSQKMYCKPHEYLWLFDGLMILFPDSQIRAKIRKNY
ncbi:protein kinase domain-containing protein [Prochlorothrix hollandica]|uniref:protein kinase domain-containing protein n=1 Tax=Prochlorothrix hollandica TaxID=1223 RepID=UPI00034CB108|nr:hypothetical protein [Prochlorothrix hollandica]